MTQQIEDDIVAEAWRLAEAAQAEGVAVRAMGGVAVKMHASSSLPVSLVRSYRDIDLVSGRKAGRETARLLTGLGYTANERFNAMQGSSRLVFYDLEQGRQVDVFVGEFRMCHAIPVAERLDVDPHTIPLAELLLTKLQIVQLNEKDLLDIWAIVLEHEITANDDDAINSDRIAELLAADWGLWRTSRQSVEHARRAVSSSALQAADQALIDERLEQLWERVEAEPKGLRWRGRAKVGDRSQWYEEPEEIAHGTLET